MNNYILKRKNELGIFADREWVRTASKASLSVELKAAIKVVGMSDINPTVSTRRTSKLHGRRQACVVTSRVANSASFGCILASPVKLLINAVLPDILRN